MLPVQKSRSGLVRRRIRGKAVRWGDAFRRDIWGGVLLSRRNGPSSAHFLPSGTTLIGIPALGNYRSSFSLIILNGSVNWSTKSFLFEQLVSSDSCWKEFGQAAESPAYLYAPLIAGSKNLFTFYGDGYELPLLSFGQGPLPDPL